MCTMIALVLRASLVGLVACGGQAHGQSSATPSEEGTSIEGNIDARPFTARSVFARRKAHDVVEILAFDREIPRHEGCARAVPAMREDGDRMLEIQMPWPPPSAGTLSTTLGAPDEQSAGFFFHMQRGRGTSGNRAFGRLEVDVSDATHGRLSFDVGTRNTPHAVHGAIRGTLGFELCP